MVTPWQVFQYALAGGIGLAITCGLISLGVTIWEILGKWLDARERVLQELRYQLSSADREIRSLREDKRLG